MDEQDEITKILCEWNGAYAELCVQCQAKFRRVEGVYPMMVVDSEDFRQWNNPPEP